MSRDPKKDKEQRHLDRFLDLQGIRVTAKEDSDPLDFVLVLEDGRRVGVELVGVDEQRQRENNVMAERHIKQEIEAALCKSGYVIQVQLIWKLGLARFARDTKRLRGFLGSLMLLLDKEAPSLGDESFVLRAQQLRGLELGELSMLVLQKVDNLTKPEVLSIPTGVGMGEPRVVAVLRDKEAKLPAYREKLGPGELWLLIVTGAQFEQNVSASLVKERSVRSLFDKVFLLDLREDRVVPLKP